jgi:hypothetical protein
VNKVQEALKIARKHGGSAGHGAKVKHQAPDPRLTAVAQDYMRQTNRGTRGPAPAIVPLNIKRAIMAARDFADMPDTSHDKLTRAAYSALARETADQYRALREAGYRFHFYNPAVHDPYAKGPSAATDDLRQNRKMGVFPSEEGFGSGEEGTGSGAPTDYGKRHPLMVPSGEHWEGKPVYNNDLFRAVHDAFGHAKQGIGFRAPGEENAYRQHAQMFTPLARMALATETRGQNSWLNYGPFGQLNRKARTVDEPTAPEDRQAAVRAGQPGSGYPGTIFGDQKPGILPVRSIVSGTEDFLPPDHPEVLSRIAQQYGRGELARRYAAGGNVVKQEASGDAIRRAAQVARGIGREIGPLPGRYAAGGEVPFTDPAQALTAQPAVAPAPASPEGEQAPPSAPARAFQPYSNLLGGNSGEHPARISTRKPKAGNEAVTGDLRVDTESAKLAKPLRETPEMTAHDFNVRQMAKYPGMPAHLRKKNAKTEDILQAFHNLSEGNLRFLHDAMPPEIRARAKLWYKGGRRIVDNFAKRYDMPDSAVAGVLASLSPQKDWYQNVSLAERVLDALHNQHDLHYTKEMEDHANRIFFEERHEGTLGKLRGKRLADIMDPEHKAMFIRLHDEAHNPRWHRLVTPEGGFGRVRTKSDASSGDEDEEDVSTVRDPSQTSWGSLAEITKAVQSAQSDGSKQALSDLMGDKHKVRNFYNNLLAPDNPYKDITMDTHAVAAGLLRPLGGSATEVSHNFGSGSMKDPYPDAVADAKKKGLPRPKRSDYPVPLAAKNSAVTGISGMYPYHADAARNVAADLQIHPRELQSITWEGVRGLFTPEQKRSKKFVAHIDGIWDNVTHGRITADEARQQILAFARADPDPEKNGKLNDPSWFNRNRPGDSNPEREWDSSYQRGIPEGGAHGEPAALASGTGGGPSGAFTGLEAEEVERHARARDLGRAVRKAHGAAGRRDGLPGTYARRAGRVGADDVDPSFGASVQGIHEPHPEAQKVWDAAGISAPAFHELTPGARSAAVFHDAVNAAKASSPNGAALTPYGPEHFKDMKLFLSPDKATGFALKGDDIVSVFNNKKLANHRNVANSMLDLAVQQGGRKLDAFDTVLPHMYTRNRFHAVSRLPWDDAETPAGWDHEAFKQFNGGRPDVVHMVYDPIKHDFYNTREGATAPDYNAALKMQGQGVKTMKKRIDKLKMFDEKAARRAALNEKRAEMGLPPVVKTKKKADGGAVGASGPEIERALVAARYYAGGWA